MNASASSAARGDAHAATRLATVGVLVFPGVEELDFVGPWEMLTMWSRYVAGPARCLIVAQHVAPVACAKGMTVVPHASFADCPPLDVLLVPGGEGTRREVDNPAIVDFVAQQARSASAVLSVCTGALLLHRAGLLEGRRATTHWSMLDKLRTLPGVQVVEERYVHDDRVWTAAGVSAGIDMTLAFIAHEAGAQAAGDVQLAAEYYPSGTRYGDAHRDPRAPAYVRG